MALAEVCPNLRDSYTPISKRKANGVTRTLPEMSTSRLVLAAMITTMEGKGLSVRQVFKGEINVPVLAVR